MGEREVFLADENRSWVAELIGLRRRLRIAEEALRHVEEVGDRAAVQVASEALSRIHTAEEK